MKRSSKNYDKIILALQEQMHGIGFDQCHLSLIPDPIFYKKIDKIVWFYQPDLMVGRGYIRISGSIGFALIGNSLSGDMSVIEALDPMGGWMISIRLENFLPVMKSGAIESDLLDVLPKFIENLSLCMSENLPRSIDGIKKMLAKEGSWLSIMTSNQADRADGYPFGNAIAALAE